MRVKKLCWTKQKNDLKQAKFVAILFKWNIWWIELFIVVNCFSLYCKRLCYKKKMIYQFNDVIADRSTRCFIWTLFKCIETWKYENKLPKPIMTLLQWQTVKWNAVNGKEVWIRNLRSLPSSYIKFWSFTSMLCYHKT